MKTLMVIFLALFLVFGAVGLISRLTYDWSKLGERTQELDEHSLARRDGRAMQFVKIEQKEIDPEQAKRSHSSLYSIVHSPCRPLSYDTENLFVSLTFRFCTIRYFYEWEKLACTTVHPPAGIRNSSTGNRCHASPFSP